MTQFPVYALKLIPLVAFGLQPPYIQTLLAFLKNKRISLL